MSSTFPVSGQADTLNLLQTTTWLRSQLGDRDNYPSVADAMADQVRDVAGMATTAFRLASDQTRSPEQRAIAARDVADRATTLIRRNADAFKRQADLLIAQGKEAADSTLGPRGGAWGYIDSEIRGWIREQAKTPEGMVAVSEAYKTDKNVASVIYSSPHFLLGLSKDLHGRMLATAVETFAPKAGARLQEGQALADVVGNYESVVTKIHRSFYNAAIVAKAEASRVEI